MWINRFSTSTELQLSTFELHAVIRSRQESRGPVLMHLWIWLHSAVTAARNVSPKKEWPFTQCWLLTDQQQGRKGQVGVGFQWIIKWGGGGGLRILNYEYCWLNSWCWNVLYKWFDKCFDLIMEQTNVGISPTNSSKPKDSSHTFY